MERPEVIEAENTTGNRDTSPLDAPMPREGTAEEVARREAEGDGSDGSKDVASDHARERSPLRSPSPPSTLGGRTNTSEIERLREQLEKVVKEKDLNLQMYRKDLVAMVNGLSEALGDPMDAARVSGLEQSDTFRDEKADDARTLWEAGKWGRKGKGKGNGKGSEDRRITRSRRLLR